MQVHRPIYLWFILAVSLGTAGDTGPCPPVDQPIEPYTRTEDFDKRRIEGWTVYIHRPLLDDAPDEAATALRILSNQLFDIARAVPGPALAELRKVPIWMQHRHPKIACACYHPSRDWLKAHRHNLDKTRSVDIGHTRHFIEWTRQQPSMVLHELAHAYHHRVLGFDHGDIRAAFEQAKQAGLYEKVRHWDGKTQRHYAMNNPKEYFAEMSEAMFGTNDFYPFVRAELKHHDRQMYRLLRKLWRMDDKGDKG